MKNRRRPEAEITPTEFKTRSSETINTPAAGETASAGSEAENQADAAPTETAASTQPKAADPPLRPKITHHRADEPRPFTIDPEFSTLFPRDASADAELKEQLGTDGCLSPLIASEELKCLLDGHGRYAICEELGLPYSVAWVSCPTHADARRRVLASQAGRRNLPPIALAFVRGTCYIQAIHQGARADLTQTEQKSAADEIAARYKISTMTVRRDGDYARAVLTLTENTGPEVLRAVLRGEWKLSRADTIKLSKASPKEQRRRVPEILKGAPKPTPTTNVKPTVLSKTKVSFQNMDHTDRVRLTHWLLTEWELDELIGEARSQFADETPSGSATAAASADQADKETDAAASEDDDSGPDDRPRAA